MTVMQTVQAAVDDKGGSQIYDLIMYVCGKYMKECGKLNSIPLLQQ